MAIIVLFRCLVLVVGEHIMGQKEPEVKCTWSNKHKLIVNHLEKMINFVRSIYM